MLNERVDRAPLSVGGRWTAAILMLVSALAIAGAGVSALAEPDSASPVTQVPPSTASPSLRTFDAIELSDAVVSRGGTQLKAARIRIEAAAQTQPGAITGFLYDQLGGVLPGVQVLLVNHTDGAKYDALSDRNGTFVFTALPAGDYELSTSLPGFAAVSNLLKVAPGATVERAVTLPLGTLQEVIAVTGGVGSRATSARQAPRAVHTRTAPEPRTFFSGGIGGQIKVPTKIVHVNPVYPADASGVSDVVVLTGRVGIDGFINDLREVSPSPSMAVASHDAFVKSALDAVSQWEFTPTLLNNVPVEANITINVQYGGR